MSEDIRSGRYLFGKWCDASDPLQLKDVNSILDQADIQRKLIANYPIDKIFELLNLVRKKWSQPNYPLRVEMQKILPKLTGFSEEMIKIGLDEIEFLLDPVVLQKKIDTEFFGIPRGIEQHYDQKIKRSLKWQPIGTVLHILSGNVFLVGVGSLLEGLLTGNVTILKMSSAEKVFMPCFVQSLIDCDKDMVVSKSIALIDYSSKQIDIIDQFKKSVDGIVVWGGEEAVRAYRDGIPARTKCVVFGPKLSFAVISKNGLDIRGIDETAKSLAFQISLWDQNACTAPQMCFVEGKLQAQLLVEKLGIELAKISQQLPAGEVDFHTAAEIRKWRSVFEIQEFRNQGLLRDSGLTSLDWSVALDEDMTIETSPLHRTLRVVAFDHFESIYQQVKPLRNYIQTVGMICDKFEQIEMSEKLGQLGALRIVTLDKMPGGEIDDPHDGSYDLPQLMHLVSTYYDHQLDGFDPLNFKSPARHKQLIDQRFRQLVVHARKSEFYKKRLSSVHIDGVDSLANIAILKRSELEANMPPHSQALQTRPSQGGYVTRSGGSTGEPKFSIHDGEDWNAMVKSAVETFHACGLDQNDRIANCMSAGDLYGSFVSFNAVNSRLGCVSFAFASGSTPEEFIKIWNGFQFNVIQGIPSSILPLLRHSKELNANFQLEKVMFAGVPLSSNDHLWLREVLGVKIITSIIGTTEAGHIGYQCTQSNGNIHHLIDDFNYIEIVNEQGQVVNDGEVGRILVTSLMKSNYPLIRYDIGDQGKILSDICPCGRKGRRLEYRGRTGDILAIGTINLNYADLRSSLSDLAVSQVQLKVQFGQQRDLLKIQVESDNYENSELKDQVCQKLFDNLHEFEDNIKQKKFDIEIVLYPIGHLKLNPRTGKLIKVIDERQ